MQLDIFSFDKENATEFKKMFKEIRSNSQNPVYENLAYLVIKNPFYDYSANLSSLTIRNPINKSVCTVYCNKAK